MARTTRQDLARWCAEHAPRHRVDAVGALTLPADLPHADVFREWVRRGDHAGLEYLARDPDRRTDPGHQNPWARSMLVFSQRYTDGWPPEAGRVGGTDWLDGVARYARGRDYHDVLLADVRRLLAELAAAHPGLEARPAVDTGPYLERELAWLAGLGFFGKNTCLIHERLGSGLFLAVAPTSLVIDDLPPAAGPQAAPLWAVAERPRRHRLDRERTSRCGTCTACLDACPTGALRAPFVLDANLCISTWTIEWRGQAPADRRDQQGGLLFGCDICQAACPWNVAAARRTGEVPVPPAEYAPAPAAADLALQDLLALDSEAFRARFRRTPLWRAHPGGMRRNALVAAAGRGRRDLLPEIRRVAAEDPDPEVRSVAVWAAARLSGDPPGTGGA